MNIFITGGLGFIGAHTTVALMNAGYQPIILDNLSNSGAEVIENIACITGQKPTFYQGDIRDRALLRTIFSQHQIEGVFHFAALKAVGESVAQPLRYYDNNVSGSLILLEEMQKANVSRIVFSSSATVYGAPPQMPINESFPTGQTTNPYGTTKHMVERILMDAQAANPHWSVMILRYFNPIGAHESGLLGESPQGIPNNLLPYVCQVATGERAELPVFGDDYDTPDGTGIRDYIHVMDLAIGHVKSFEIKGMESGVHIYNLGTGKGYSVLEIIRAFEHASGKTIPYAVQPRRAGDVAVCYADCAKAAREIDWQAQRDLDDMMVDAWRWWKYKTGSP